MENKHEENKDYYDMAEAQDLLSRREDNSNGAEIANWLCMSANIVKSYRDGYISDKDIADREKFMNYTFGRETLLTTCLGLLEKSNDPKARAQMEVLKRQLAILRMCRANLMHDTPPKNVAKRIQQKQEERQEKISGVTKTADSSFASDQNKSFDHGLFFNPFANSKNNNNDKSLAIIGVLLLAGMSKKQLQEKLINVQQKGLNEGNNPSIDDLCVSALAFFRKKGLNSQNLDAIMNSDLTNQQHLATIQKVLASVGIDDVDTSVFNASMNYGFAKSLRESIYRQDIMLASAYDYGIANPLLHNRIEAKSREDIIQHQKDLLLRKTLQRDSSKNTNDKLPFTVDNYYKLSNDSRSM